MNDDTGRIAMLEVLNPDYDSDGSDPELTRYIYSNHLQSASLELDGSGEIISYEEYHPYGTTSYQAMSAAINAVAKRYRYTGKERDEESGLYYHGARYYVPWLARWTACDPMEAKFAGLSPYNYGFNNPVIWQDSTGMEPDKDGISQGSVKPKTIFLDLDTGKILGEKLDFDEQGNESFEYNGMYIRSIRKNDYDQLKDTTGELIQMFGTGEGSLYTSSELVKVDIDKIKSDIELLAIVKVLTGEESREERSDIHRRRKLEQHMAVFFDVKKNEISSIIEDDSENTMSDFQLNYRGKSPAYRGTNYNQILLAVIHTHPFQENELVSTGVGSVTEVGLKTGGGTYAIEGTSDKDKNLAIQVGIPNYAIQEFRFNKNKKFFDVVPPQGERLERITNKAEVLQGAFDIIESIFKFYNQ